MPRGARVATWHGQEFVIVSHDLSQSTSLMSGRIILRDAWKDEVVCDGVAIACAGGFRGFRSVPLGAHTCVNHGATVAFTISSPTDVTVAILEGDTFRTLSAAECGDFPYHSMARSGQMDRKLQPWPAPAPAAAAAAAVAPAAATSAAAPPAWMADLPPEMQAAMLAIEAAKAKGSSDDIKKLERAAAEFAASGSDAAAAAWGDVLHSCHKTDSEMADLQAFYAPFSEAVCTHVEANAGLVRGRAATDLRYLAQDLPDAADDAKDAALAARMRAAGERLARAL